jgi:hypothetical protein
MDLDLTSDLLSGKKTFVLKPGKYNITKTIEVIGIDNVSISSSTKNPSDVEIIFTDGMDGIVVKNSNYFTMRGVTITLNDTRTNTYQGVTLVMEQCSYFNISKCIFNGTQRGYGFGIFLAGPKVWSDEDMYDINNDGQLDNTDKQAIITQKILSLYNSNSLMNYNKFNNNVVNCISRDDGFSFSLQYKSDCSNNIINGTRLAIYMVKNCNIVNNIVNDSVTDAMFVSTPCHTVNINNNKINNPQGNGVVVDEETDHTLTPEQQESISNNFNIDICFNTIVMNTPGPVGIAIRGCRNTLIRKNTLYVPENIGILTRGRVAGLDENGNRIYFPSSSRNIITQNNINMFFNSYGDVFGFNDTIKSPSIFLTEYSYANTVSENNIFFGALGGSQKIQFYELTDKNIIVDGQSQIDPVNRYPKNNFKNVIVNNIIFVPKDSGIQIDQCIDMTSTTALQNKFQANTVVEL